MTTGLESRMDHRIFEADELSVKLPNLVSLTLFYVPEGTGINPYVRVNATIISGGKGIRETKIILTKDHRNNAKAYRNYNEFREKILKGEYRLEDLGKKLAINFL